MAAKECHVEDLEPEAIEFPFVEKRKQGVPFPSSVYGRSVVEKYLTSDRNRTPDGDLTEAFGSHVERTKGLLRASPAATHLAIPGLREGGATQVWRQSDPLLGVAEANGVGGGDSVDLDLELLNVSAQGEADLPENMATGESQVSSAFRALSKRFSMRRNPWQKVKRKSDKPRPVSVKPMEARRTPSDPSFDLESSPVVEDSRALGFSFSEEDPPGSGLGVEDLSKYLIVPGKKTPLHVVPIEEVHPFAVPENLPLKFNTIVHNTILNDELDRKYDRIRVIYDMYKNTDAAWPSG